MIAMLMLPEEMLQLPVVMAGLLCGCAALILAKQIFARHCLSAFWAVHVLDYAQLLNAVSAAIAC